MLFRKRQSNISLLSILVLFAGFGFSCKQGPQENTIPSTGNETLDQLNLAIQKDSTNHQLLFERANLYYDSEDYDASIVDLLKAIHLDSTQFAYFHLLSDSYMDYYKSRDALRIMETAAELFPRNIPTLLKLSETQHILKLYEESLMTIARILTIDDQNPEAYFMMGLNFRSVEEYDRAINAFRTATELNPELIDAWLILGKLYENQNNPEAIKYYDAAINVNPDNVAAWHSKAFYLQNKSRISEAIEIYKKINQIDKYYLDAYLNAGILYMEQDSFQNAYEQFDIMASLKSQNYLAYYYRALASQSLGNTELAITDLQNCLNLNPEFSKASQLLFELKKSS